MEKITMVGILDANHIQIRRLSPDDNGQYFFGYYDNLAFHPEKPWHLCHKVSFMDRLPTSDDICQLGILNLDTREFMALAETNAWNFQQGAMLQWNPINQKEMIYNVYRDGGYHAVVKHIKSGSERVLSRAVACVSPDGRWGLSINMSRVYDFRPGYGYCNKVDSWFTISAPAEDGVFLLDMMTGKEKQILSYEYLKGLFGCGEGQKDRKIVINHITFNRESDRFVFLLRYFPPEGETWKTCIGTSDLEGHVYQLRPYTFASHYNWKEKGTLMIYADCGEGDGLYELKDESQSYYLYDRSIFSQDIHCSYSPNRQWILGDGYQDKAMYRPVYLYHIESGRGMIIGRFYSPHLANADIRCDLHCRWSPDGRYASFDSIHEGKRGVYLMDLIEAMETILQKRGGKVL